MNANLSFNDLPQAIRELYVKLENIESLLLKKGSVFAENLKEWFDIDELCDYLPDKPTKSTVYGWVQARSIPYHKGKKRLRFLKPEIDVWLSSNEKKTVQQISYEARSYMNHKRKDRVSDA